MIVLKKKILRFFKIFFDAPVNVYNNVYLNLIGFQLFRYLTHNFLYMIRYKLKKIDDQFLEYYNQLKHEGIVKIDNFFSAKEFNFVEKVFNQKMKFQYKNLNQVTGINWTNLNFDKDTKDEDLKKIYDLFVNNELINKLICTSLNIKRIGNPIIGFQVIENPENNKDNKDRETLIHSDRFYPCFKLFLTLNENSVKNGAYKYYKYSHLFSFRRSLHEYDFSIRQSLLNKGFNLKHNIKLNRCLPKKFYVKKILNNLNDITSKENTLVISNNKGFHQRGIMESGTTRKQIRIVFYYLQKRFYYSFFKRIYNYFLLEK